MENIRNLAREYNQLTADISRIMWAQYTTGFDFGLKEAEQKLNGFLDNKAHYKMICDEMEKNTDQLTHRKVFLLHKKFKWHHLSEKANSLRVEIQGLENSLSDVLNKHRIVIDNNEMESVEVSKLISTSSNRDIRKKAYLSRAQVNKPLVDAGFIKLIHLRNEYAHQCGYSDYVELRLDQDELPRELFNSWSESCGSRASRLNDRKVELAKAHLGCERLDPWDASYLENQISSFKTKEIDLSNFKKPIENVFEDFGFNIKSLNLTYDVYPRKNKSEWGYNFVIEIGKDTRVLANINNRFFNYWTLLHETAHGVHFLGLNPDEELLNLGVSGIIAEGFANFFGNLSYSKEFLSEIFGDESEKAFNSFEEMKEVAKLQNFASISEAIFDVQLYRSKIDSINDIHQLKWDVERDLLGRDPYSDEPLWGFLIHHTTAPIYLQNYFLGDVLCEDMKEKFQSKTNTRWDESPKQFGEFWKSDVLDLSGKYSFYDLYRNVCEKELSLDGFLDFCLDTPNKRKI